MLNKCKSIISVLAFSLLAVSCFKDDRNNFLPDETVYVHSDAVNDVAASTGKFDVVLIKSGRGLSSGSVTLNIDADVLVSYNTGKKNPALSLPENVYSVSESTVRFAKDDFRKIVEITWEPTAVNALLSIGNYAIPISISANGLECDADRSTVLIHLTK